MHRLLHLSDAACAKILADIKAESVESYKPAQLREQLRRARDVERSLIADRAWFIRIASERSNSIINLIMSKVVDGAVRVESIVEALKEWNDNDSQQTQREVG